jgi:two-component system, NarL family, sensor histidine kinase UhpB
MQVGGEWLPILMHAHGPSARLRGVVSTLASTPLRRTADRSPVAKAALRPRIASALAWLHAAVISPWHRSSIRTQLLIIVLVIELAAALVAGVVTILKARTSTRVEIEASMRLAQLFVTEALRLVHDDIPVQHVLSDVPLQARLPRHVRISVHDLADVPVAQIPAPIDPVTTRKAESPPAPAWFQALIAPAIERHVIPITARGQPIGSVVIVSEPKDEIAEVWESTVALALVALAVTAAMMAALYVLFGRALAPLTGLARGLTDLEHRDYAVRLPVPETREFVALATRFNALAQTLENARAENVRLNQRLITAQDDERRNIALELHDEVGPSLFGLKAIATSIGTIAADSFEAMRQTASERIADMLPIIEHLQTVNRGLLNRLRPMALGHVPLQDLVARLVQDRAREHPQIDFRLDAANLTRTYGDTIDLTIYRCVQESLTNAIRHSAATQIVVTVGEPSGDASQLVFNIEDDGQGIGSDAPRGLGLAGMEERVRALGGQFVIEPRPDGGTVVHAVIPLTSPRRPA